MTKIIPFLPDGTVRAGSLPASRIHRSDVRKRAVPPREIQSVPDGPQETKGGTGIDDVLDDEHILSGNRGPKIEEQPDRVSAVQYSTEDTLKAIRVHTFGGPEVMVPEEVPRPSPGEGQALVRVEAAGVNFIDIYQRLGQYPVPLPMPWNKNKPCPDTNCH